MSNKQFLKNHNIAKNEQHPFHLVDNSPWPLFTSIAALQFIIGLVSYMHRLKHSLFYLYIGLAFLLFCMYRWFVDIITESTYQGNHTWRVQRGLRYGMLLFIVSEIMFFFAFFWAFFHSSLSPSIWIGGVWPPVGIEVVNPWGLPLFNTIILLSSGVSLTWAHRGFKSGHRRVVIDGLIITILLGILFTECQMYEYILANFSINDSVYGSVFYMATGFHGFHVLVGTIFLVVCLVRQIRYHFTRQHHFGFEAAAWYWHFVDVVWIFLFLWIYIWGSFTY